MMDALAEDELLLDEQADAEQMLTLWDELCGAVMESLEERTPEKVDDLLTVNNVDL